MGKFTNPAYAKELDELGAYVAVKCLRRAKTIVDSNHADLDDEQLDSLEKLSYMADTAMSAMESTDD